VELTFGGGYAFVVNDEHRVLTVGPVARPSIFSSEFMLHRMKLVVTEGLIDPRKTTVPTERVGMGSDHSTGWDFTDRSVRLLVAGTEIPKSTVMLPTDSPLGKCDEGMKPTNNRAFIPDLVALSGLSELVDRWEERLRGRITLHGGTLSVTDLAKGCFTFHQNGVEKETKRLVNGQHGLTHSQTISGTELTLNVQDMGGTSIGDIVIINVGAGIKLTVNTHDDNNPKANTRIAHFRYFYQLLKMDASALRQIPTWLGFSVGVVTPGEACPPGLIEVP